jgi:hypothetical protein
MLILNDEPGGLHAPLNQSHAQGVGKVWKSLENFGGVVLFPSQKFVPNKQKDTSQPANFWLQGVRCGYGVGVDNVRTQNAQQNFAK